MSNPVSKSNILVLVIRSYNWCVCHPQKTVHMWWTTNLEFHMNSVILSFLQWAINNNFFKKILLDTGNVLQEELGYYLTNDTCRNNSNSQYPLQKDLVYAVYLLWKLAHSISNQQMKESWKILTSFSNRPVFP